MDWTKNDTASLLKFKESVDSDDIKVKERIKQVLLENKYILHVLDNEELEEADAEADDYYGICILPYYMITPTQSSVKNYLCFEVSYNTVDRGNKAVKTLEIIFYVLCHHSDIRDRDTGIARHDLLAALIQEQFNFTNYFGSKIRLVSNVPSVVDNNYATRTLTFQQVTDNNLVKTGSLGARLSNKDVIRYAET